MPLWDKTSTKPVWVTGANSRNVIATSQGWVHRRTYTDTHSKARVKDEVLVHIGELSTTTTMALPNIVDMYFNFAANTVANDTLSSLYIVYDEPVNVSDDSLTIAIANTDGFGGAPITAYSNATADTADLHPVEGANNTIRFTFTPAATGEYRVDAQAIGNTGLVSNVYPLDTDAGTANLTITSAVSNKLGSFTVT